MTNQESQELREAIEERKYWLSALKHIPDAKLIGWSGFSHCTYSFGINTFELWGHIAEALLKNG